MRTTVIYAIMAIIQMKHWSRKGERREASGMSGTRRRRRKAIKAKRERMRTALLSLPA